MLVIDSARGGRLLSALALCCALALPAAYGFSFWYWQQNLDANFERPVPLADSAIKIVKPSYAQLALLFGSAQVEQVAEPVKQSTLSLKLVASYVGGKQGRSAAVIASSESNHQLYYQGDKLLPGVELVTVQARRVLIKRNGVLESVSLEEYQPQDRGREPGQPAPVGLARSATMPPTTKSISQQKLTDKLNKLKAMASGEI